MALKYWGEPSIYFIMGTGNVNERNPLTVLEEALSAGISFFQLREKGAGALSGHALKKFAQDCQRLCKVYGVPFIINDNVALAREIDADGIHIGQEDEDAAAVRKQIGPGKILGVSVHSVEEAGAAIVAGADYVGMGPVFPTSSKSDAKSPAGAAGILSVKSIYPQLPIVGIGGITPENAGHVWSAGAEGVAVISAIAQAEDVALQVGLFKNSYKKGGVR
ncbi:thiamine phosphate synthase [Planomicrobium sp. CPCC 101079]|uniref:thiamine phosphate synthase n=1 Tax=Planomicrobium sp. CPCC 101079 TaxID=2599618 RepID=UPI0011B41C4E|nr:thiamine phosphate synthase [Planomicrobium sp. CPCC 101079]TWT06186.1 thiamine phosphate synthase [Planomicrobium sp. CPCC 101079]